MMASWSRFKALWTHRYRKYTHIAGKYLSAWWKITQLRTRKARLTGRPLVAVVLSEQMGDLVACEPVGREVRRRYPNAHIVWFVRQPYRELVANNPHIDGYLIEKCPGERTRILASGVFDEVFNMHLSHRKCKYCKEDPVNPTADALGFTYANYYAHGDLLAIFSQAAGLPAITDNPVLYIPETVQQAVANRQIPAGGVVIHCQSSYAPRDWPADHWNQLVSWLLDTYPYPVLEVGLKPTVTVQHPRFVNLCGQLSILETAECIRRSRLFIGIDSGPAHFANAAGTEGVILLGKLFDFVEYLPYSGRYKRGEGVTILNYIGHPCPELPYDWVQRAVEQRLENQAIRQPRPSADTAGIL